MIQSPQGATQPNDLPTAESAAVARMRKKWQRCRDVRGGTDVFRDRATTYLPRYLVEDEVDWQGRVNLTTVPDFLDQAINAMVGIALRHDPELGKSVPSAIKEDWEDLDGAGNHGTVVLGNALDKALQDGHHVLFVDMTVLDARPDLTEQRERGIRPYVVPIGVDQIVSWRTVIRGGRKMIGQFVYHDTSEEADGVFLTKSVTRYRVLRLTDAGVEWELWVEGADKKVAREKGPLPLKGPKEIPLAVVYGGMPTNLLESIPPFDGLAQSVIRWAQVESDLANSLHLAGIPIPVIVGKLLGRKLNDDGTAAEPEITLSTSRGLQLDVGGSFGFESAGVEALEPARNELKDWESRMGAQALSLLRPGNERVTETATESRRQGAKEESKVQRAIRSLEDAGERVLHFIAQYRGLPVTGCELTIRRDIGEPVGPETIRLFSELEQRGQLTLERLLIELKRAGVTGSDFDPQAEAKRLATAEDVEGSDEPDLETLEDDELEARFAELEATVARRRAAAA